MKNLTRYYLHRIVKTFARLKAQNGKGFIYLPYQKAENLTDREKKYLDKLRAIGYQLQTEIPMPEATDQNSGSGHHQ